MSKISQLKKKEKYKEKKDYFNMSEAELIIEILLGNINWDEISKEIYLLNLFMNLKIN
jgi:recombinational DNA repair protein (RecF pathway)